MINQDPKNCKNDKPRVFWQFHITAWADTKLSQAAYCRQNNLRPNQFTYWKKQLLEKNLPVEFVQVPETTLKTVENNFFRDANAPCLRLCVSSGFAIDIPDGFSPDTLARTLMVLKEA